MVSKLKIEDEDGTPNNAAVPDDDVRAEEGAVVPEVGVDEGQGEGDASDAAALSLQQQLEAANARAAENERRANAAERERARLLDERTRTQADLTVSNAQVIDNALAAAESERRELRAQLRAAKEAGDYDAEVEAQDKLMALAVKMQRLSEGKADLESRVEQERENARRPADPVESYIQSANLTPRAANWIRSHAEVVSDRPAMTKLTAAHWAALADGIPEGSDDYFAALDARMGYGEAPEPRQAAVPRAPAAPVSRANIGSEAPRPGTIRLSADQREAARVSGISDAEYAASLAAINRERATTH